MISTVIEILGNELDFFYCESESSPRIHFGKSNLVNCATSSGKAIQEDVDYPKISLEFPTSQKLESNVQFIQEGSDSGETSGDGCDLYKHKSKISLPFCSKRVCRESDTPHVKKGIGKFLISMFNGNYVNICLKMYTVVVKNFVEFFI